MLRNRCQKCFLISVFLRFEHVHILIARMPWLTSRCNTLQHTAATHCNTLSNTTTHCHTLQHNPWHNDAITNTARKSRNYSMNALSTALYGTMLVTHNDVIILSLWLDSFIYDINCARLHAIALAWIHAHTHTNTNTHTHAHINICIYICTCVYVRVIYIHIHIHICIRIYIHRCVCIVCICVYIYMYICIHTYKYTYTYVCMYTFVRVYIRVHWIYGYTHLCT